MCDLLKANSVPLKSLNARGVFSPDNCTLVQ